MEVKTGEMDSALENVYEGTISQDEVSNLLGEIKDQAAMENAGSIGASVGVGAVANANAAQPSAVKEDDMSEM